MKLKLSEKLLQLSLNKFRYKVSMPLQCFYDNHFEGYNVEVQDDIVVFYCNKIKKKELLQNNIVIEDRLKRILKKIFKTNLVSSLSIMIILGLFIMSNYFIREVKFSNEHTYNFYVLADVEKEVKSIGPFSFINKNLNDLSNELREKYFEYPYIGIRKKSGTIYIDIEIPNQYPTIIDSNPNPCDIVSNVDGKVVGFEVKKGIPIVNVNQIVKKGDCLITGNLNYQVNPNDLSKLVHSEGVVLIEYATYVNIVIPKEVEYEFFEKEYKKYYALYLFNKYIGKNRINEKNDILVEETIFDLYNLVSVKENVVFSVIKKQKEISEEQAKIISEQKIYSQFLNNQVSSKEEIKFIKFISIKVEDDKYVCNYLVKCIKNEVVEVLIENGK